MKPVKLFEEFLNEAKYTGSLYHGGAVDFNKPMYFTNSLIIAQSYGEVTGPYQITLNKFVTLDYSTAEGWWLPEEATQRECKKFGMKPEDFNKYKQFSEVKSIKTDHFVRAAIDKGFDGIIFENIMDAGSHPVKGNKYIRTTNVVSLKPQKSVILLENQLQDQDIFLQRANIDSHYDMVDFFRSHLDDSWDNPKKQESLFRNAKTQIIHTDSIVPNQDYLRMDQVQRNLNKPLRKEPLGVQFPDGRVILHDGHHRVAAEILKGNTQIRMKIINSN